MNPGQELQQLVRTLERLTAAAENIQIESPKRVRDKDTARLREHDVVITFSMKHHELVVALECRDRSRKVTVNEIESFKKKCESTAVHRGIIVSSKGFTKTALKKAEMMDIGCFGLNEIDRFNWCQTPGIECRVREIVEGQHFTMFPPAGVSAEPVLYDEEGRALDGERASNVVNNCLNNRPTEVAEAQDAAAVESLVPIQFIDNNPSAWHVLDSE